jgi:hypothetical protein
MNASQSITRFMYIVICMSETKISAGAPLYIPYYVYICEHELWNRLKILCSNTVELNQTCIAFVLNDVNRKLKILDLLFSRLDILNFKSRNVYFLLLLLLFFVVFCFCFFFLNIFVHKRSWYLHYAINIPYCVKS